MTTESPGRNLRLYLVAALALAYLVVWWSFGMQPKPAVATAEVAPPRLEARAPAAAPVRRTQTVSTTTATRTVRPAPVPVRVPPRRVVRTRVRTRSS